MTHTETLAGGIGSRNTDAIDLQAWLERIHYRGSLEPSSESLAALVDRHMAAIPFEAIDVMLDRGVNLAPEAIDRKMLQGQRGGYCFEHASLMRRALRALGYTVEQQLGRVWVSHDLTGPAPSASHAMLKVLANEQWWLVDVGFGSFLSNEPLAWRLDEPQATAYGAFRLVRTLNGVMLETLYRDQWSPLYEILDFAWQAVDFEVANHYVAWHTESHFRHELMVARTEGDVRRTLAGNRFKLAQPGGGSQEQWLDVEGMTAVLRDEFGLPVAAEWLPLLERIVADSREG
ncbi:arylamine N-acetyltransferase family protein [Halomonas huangheensis]|uniref:N-hydroxyarylamine O-acetyltransferase n=1 Tax=Halomonas huangheensis TaxID=1178482 RepID=W1N281_9GAMM|nr:arylamine N-acetyltransferase [Halomonas huangheensis]ALM51178.1 hypothetical protein AR456_01875 [Halomonas huangheensis]ERL49594.1 hypothetical protein BJB45_00315 [Halomonas huangheensis]